MQTVLIIDFGSQYNQLIARRVRENKVYCQIVPPSISARQILSLAPKGIILSGGPASIYQKNAPKLDKNIYNLGIPILGICYGMQAMAHQLGGRVSKAKKREYGFAELKIDDKKDLFFGLTNKISCWMSHGDQIASLPKNFIKLGHTKNSPVAAFADRINKFYGVQFHPEVIHTQFGSKIIANFLFIVCKCKAAWTMKLFIKEAIKNIKNKTCKKRVVLGLSGGVDSSVCAVLVHKAIGRQLTCIFVDNGLLRKNEAKSVEGRFKKHFGIDVHFVNAQNRFLTKLKGVIPPEEKRKIIGREFIRVFEQEASKIKNVEYLVQGTLYPDVIESRSAFGGPSATIKTHHNVGGLPKIMKLKLIEPLRELFKDEVRLLGKELGMPDEIIWRQPFPGPGLAVRIIGEVTRERLNTLKDVDEVVVDEIKKANLYRNLWQSFSILLPIKSVGVMGDERTYENVVAIRAVTSQDGMTADWAKLPYDVMGRISNRIINEVKGVNRVVYDISSKPPATIEWE